MHTEVTYLSIQIHFIDENGKLKEVHYALTDGQLGNLHFMFRVLMDIDRVRSNSTVKNLPKYISILLS